MGKSTTVRQSIRLQAMEILCRANSGKQNVWSEDGNEFFFEAGNQLHRGEVFQVKDDKCYRIGSYRISDDGKLSTSAKFLKSKVYVLSVDGCESLYRGDPEDLVTFLKTDWITQFYPGGVNAHVSKSLGHIPYPSRAEVIDLNTGDVVASWKPAMFEVL